jgi:hypothetical protein
VREPLQLAKIRRRIEHDYRELKHGLGLDHFEGRNHDGWYRHVTMVSLAQAICTRLRFAPRAPSAAAPGHMPNDDHRSNNTSRVPHRFVTAGNTLATEPCTGYRIQPSRRDGRQRNTPPPALPPVVPPTRYRHRYREGSSLWTYRLDAPGSRDPKPYTDCCLEVPATPSTGEGHAARPVSRTAGPLTSHIPSGGTVIVRSARRLGERHRRSPGTPSQTLHRGRPGNCPYRGPRFLHRQPVSDIYQERTRASRRNWFRQDTRIVPERLVKRFPDPPN